jgi:hypothetical protein
MIDESKSKPAKAKAEGKLVAKKPTNISRRGMEKHTTNPFLAEVADATHTRVKKITSNGEMMMVSRDSGEVVAGAGFWHTQLVDKTQFVKLYINGVKAFSCLSSAGTRVFELMYREIQANIGKDRIYMSFQAIDQDKDKISEATYYRGMKELVEKNFLAETTIQGFYFVNPDHLWNGDRLAFVKEYRLRTPVGKKADSKTLDLFDHPTTQEPQP